VHAPSVYPADAGAASSPPAIDSGEWKEAFPIGS
jgi:hypothetical protein